MDEKQKKHIGKFLSLVLRHKPESIGITLDNAGWVAVDVLLEAVQKKGILLNHAQLEEIVRTNGKQRYQFKDSQRQIRANQGHSLSLDLQLDPVKPPTCLYHGTATPFLAAIKQDGLQKRSRHHVHLSKDKETAHQVGSRHGKAVILTVNANDMHDDGFIFYCSENGVWLVDHVPVAYFSQAGRSGIKFRKSSNYGAFRSRFFKSSIIHSSTGARCFSSLSVCTTSNAFCR